MNLNRMYEWVEEQARNAAVQWCKLQTLKPYASLYLYYKIGELTVSEDCPQGFTLATGQRLRPNSTIDQQQIFINSIARKTPFLPDYID